MKNVTDQIFDFVKDFAVVDFVRVWLVVLVAVVVSVVVQVVQVVVLVLQPLNCLSTATQPSLNRHTTATCNCRHFFKMWS